MTAVGGEVIAFPAATKNPLKLLANARAIRRMVATEGVDLIHARSRAPAWSALLAARRAAVPFVTTYHGAYGETNALKKLYNSVMARGDVVIANSRYTADLIASRYATPRERLEVIHRGVDVGAFDPQGIAPDRVAELRRRWGVAPEQRVILQAARLTRWKGQGVLIDAVAQLQRRGALQGAVAILAGDAQGRDGYVKELQAQIERLGLKEHVRLVGHVEDVAAAYAASHVTVVASIEPEAFGRTAIEAAAVACPVIATNIGAPPETVHGSTDCCARRNNGMVGASKRRRSAGAFTCRGARPGAGGAPGNGRKGAPARARQFYHRGHAAPYAGGLRQAAGDGVGRSVQCSDAGKRSQERKRPATLTSAVNSPILRSRFGHPAFLGRLGAKPVQIDEGDCNIRRPSRGMPERAAASGPRMNEDIRVPEVRLIDHTGQNVGVVTTEDAMARAIAAGLDLVEISPDASPPVAKILDYGKYKYQEQKKAGRGAQAPEGRGDERDQDAAQHR